MIDRETQERLDDALEADLRAIANADLKAIADAFAEAVDKKMMEPIDCPFNDLQTESVPDEDAVVKVQEKSQSISG